MNRRKFIRNTSFIAFIVAMLPMVNGTADSAVTPKDKTPIDRHALVTRHDIDWPSLDGQIPLGNGNFAFNADGTGLETVGGNTMSHWCWHSFPLPPGVTQADIKPWATPDHGRLKGLTTTPPGAIFNWERDNPQPLNLGRIGFVNRDGERLSGADVHVDSRHLDLWTGLLTSRFTYLGQTVEVQTCVDPKTDTVAVHVESSLLRDARLQIMLDFPAPAQNVGAWVGDFSRATGHQTTIIRQTSARLELNRSIDDAQYQVMLAGRGFTVGRPIAVQAPATVPTPEAGPMSPLKWPARFTTMEPSPPTIRSATIPRWATSSSLRSNTSSMVTSGPRFLPKMTVGTLASSRLTALSSCLMREPRPLILPAALEPMPPAQLQLALPKQRRRD
jgi:hypothetical protein